MRGWGEGRVVVVKSSEPQPSAYIRPLVIQFSTLICVFDISLLDRNGLENKMKIFFSKSEIWKKIQVSEIMFTISADFLKCL